MHNAAGPRRGVVAGLLVRAWAFVLRLVARVLTWIVNWWSGTTELERLCAAHGYARDATLVLALDAYLARSSSAAVRGISDKLVGPATGTTAAAAATASASATTSAGTAAVDAADSKAAADSSIAAMDGTLDHASLSAADRQTVATAIDTLVRERALSGAPIDALRRSLEYALGQMRALNVLVAALDAERCERYSTDNPAHERDLMRLWTALRPDTRLSARLSTDWEEVGFQGRDPATDFRGAGVLGLHQLLEFAASHPTVCATIVRNTAHAHWFGFAITGLNLTHHLLTSLLPPRRAAAGGAAGAATAGPLPNAIRTPFAHFVLSAGVSRRSITALYAIYFTRLNDAWVAANPPNVMSFGAIHDEVRAQLLADAAARRLTKPNPLPTPVLCDRP